jgi:hypothetical protein
MTSSGPETRNIGAAMTGNFRFDPSAAGIVIAGLRALIR